MLTENPILQPFSCERLSINRSNLLKIKSFRCEKNGYLQDYIRSEAWNDDVLNNCAVYLVKYYDDPIFYFTLKCSALYSLFEDIDESDKNYFIIKPYLDKMSDITDDDEFYKLVKRLKEDGIDQRSIDLLKGKYWNSKLARKVAKDKNKDSDNKLPRVNKSVPVIELVHFCANDKTKNLWEFNKYNHKLGTVVFYSFISPIVESIYKQLGCTQLFLFAADGTENGKLIRYYKGAMKFKELEGLFPIKSSISLLCSSLSIKISAMQENRKKFFENFILDNTTEDFV